MPYDSLLLAGDPASARGLFESRELAQKYKGNAVHRPVSLLGDLQFGLRAFFVGHFALFLEKIRPVNEEHHIGVLFDRARFAQVRELRAALFAFGRARELAETPARVP